MSSWVQRYIQAPPPKEQLVVNRVKVDGICPECGADDIRRYPVSNYHGARIVEKCQACFHVVKASRPTAEDNWPPFRAVTYDWPASPAERTSRDTLERALG